MNMKVKIPTIKKKSTFDRYVRERSEQTEGIIKTALRVVDATRYGNVTDFCKALAAVASEIRQAKSCDPNTPFFNKNIRSFSYITLLRNVNYRRLIDVAFEQGRVKNEEPEAISEEALLKISSLQGQVNLLRDRLSGIRTSGDSNALTDTTAQDIISQLSTFLDTTITVYSSMRHRFQKLTRIRESPTEQHRIPGLYDAKGLIADLEALHTIENGRSFLEQLSKSKEAIE